MNEIGTSEKLSSILMKIKIITFDVTLPLHERQQQQIVLRMNCCIGFICMHFGQPMNTRTAHFVLFIFILRY